MYPFELESRISVMLEPIGRPDFRGAVTSFAILPAVLPELTAMDVRMACVARGGRTFVHTSPTERAVALSDSLWSMTVPAFGPRVSPGQWIARLMGMVIGPDVECAGILPMASGAVARGHLTRKLPGVRIGVTRLTLAIRGCETTNRGSRTHEMAANTRNRRMGPGEWVECRMS